MHEYKQDINSEPPGPISPPPHNAALSRRRSENMPPYDYKAIPAENNPPPTINRVNV